MKIRKRSFCKIEMYGLLVILTALLLCIIGRTVPYSVPKQVVLNEVCSSNFTLIRDENGAYSDYVELFIRRCRIALEISAGFHNAFAGSVLCGMAGWHG